MTTERDAEREPTEKDDAENGERDEPAASPAAAHLAADTTTSARAAWRPTLA
jgi:hypothetical protein